jgi:hypothetical protein
MKRSTISTLALASLYLLTFGICAAHATISSCTAYESSVTDGETHLTISAPAGSLVVICGANLFTHGGYSPNAPIADVTTFTAINWHYLYYSTPLSYPDVSATVIFAAVVPAGGWSDVAVHDSGVAYLDSTIYLAYVLGGVSNTYLPTGGFDDPPLWCTNGSTESISNPYASISSMTTISDESSNIVVFGEQSNDGDDAYAEYAEPTGASYSYTSPSEVVGSGSLWMTGAYSSAIASDTTVGVEISSSSTSAPLSWDAVAISVW